MTDPNIPNTARPQLFFNCGELQPASFRYDGLPTIIYNQPYIPGIRNPIIIRPYPTDDEPWVCVCRNTDLTSEGDGGCLDSASRECVKRSQVVFGPNTRISTTEYSTKAECENSAFNEAPCALSVYECVTQARDCPYDTVRGSIFGRPLPGSFILDRDCVRRPNQRNRPVGLNIFATLGECIPNCLDVTSCRYPEPDPQIPIGGGGGGGGPTGGPFIPITPRIKYKCVETNRIICEDLNGSNPPVIAVTKSCQACTEKETLLNPLVCRYSANNCSPTGRIEDSECKSTVCGTKCISSNPIPCFDPRFTYVKKACVACTTQDISCVANQSFQTCRSRCITTLCPPITPRPPILPDVPVVVVEEPKPPIADDPETRIPTEEPSENEVEGDPEQVIQVIKPPRQRQGYNCESRDGRRVCVACLGDRSVCQYDTEIDCLRTCFVNENVFVEVPRVKPPRNPSYIYQSDYDNFLAQAQTTSDIILNGSVKLTLPPNSNKKLNNIKVVGDKPRYIKTINLNAPKNVIYEDKFNGAKVLLKSEPLYDEIYNFFNKKPSPTTKLNYNSIRTDIFSDVVAEEVFFFLNKYAGTTNVKWNEIYYFNLTLDKLAISIRKELGDAFESIHHIDNTLIGKNVFLEVLRRLLVSGRLNEFDPDFYIDLANRQSNDQLLSMIYPDSKLFSEKIALTLSLNQSLPSDDSYYTAANKFRILRQKRLNTDVGANITVETVSATVALPLEDAGIAIIPLTGVDATDYVSIGVGDGYFIDATTETEQVKIPVNTYVSASLMTPASVRYTAARAANLDPNSVISVTSTNSNIELSSNYVESTEGPLYFILDLSSVSFIKEEDVILNKISCSYKLTKDQQAINNHTINYGFNVVKVPVDFRDPLFTYASDTSSINLQMPDISLRNLDFYLSGTFDNSFILTRNIPFGIVLVPGCGSKHNPFDGFSQLVNRSNTITRSLSITPTIKVTDYGLLDNSLKEFDTEETLKPPPDYFGYSNKLYYSYSTSDYTGTYYYNKEYLSNRPINITSPITIVSKIVNEIVNPLVEMYSPKELKWFDIFSRLTENEMGDYFNNGDINLLRDLIKERYNITVKDVLSTDLDSKTGLIITDDYNDSIPNVRPQVILPEDRYA